MKRIDLEYLHSLLKYDEHTGELIWRRNKKVAGGPLKSGYIKIQVKGKQYLAHRLVWFYHNGYFPEKFIDHIDRNNCNNKIENLREVSNQCNQRNSKLNCLNTSGVKGVIFDKSTKHWLVRIGLGNKMIHVGCSKDLTEAVAHRLAAEQALGWEGCDSSSPAYLYMQKVL